MLLLSQLRSWDRYPSLKATSCLAVLANIFNHCTQEAEARVRGQPGLEQVPVQPRLHQALSEKNQKAKPNKQKAIPF